MSEKKQNSKNPWSLVIEKHKHIRTLDTSTLKSNIASQQYNDLKAFEVKSEYIGFFDKIIKKLLETYQKDINLSEDERVLNLADQILTRDSCWLPTKLKNVNTWDSLKQYAVDNIPTIVAENSASLSADNTNSLLKDICTAIDKAASSKNEDSEDNNAANALNSKNFINELKKDVEKYTVDYKKKYEEKLVDYITKLKTSKFEKKPITTRLIDSFANSKKYINEQKERFKAIKNTLFDRLQRKNLKNTMKTICKNVAEGCINLFKKTIYVGFLATMFSVKKIFDLAVFTVKKALKLTVKTLKFAFFAPIKLIKLSYKSIVGIMHGISKLLKASWSVAKFFTEMIKSKKFIGLLGFIAGFFYKKVQLVVDIFSGISNTTTSILKNIIDNPLTNYIADFVKKESEAKEGSITFRIKDAVKSLLKEFDLDNKKSFLNNVIEHIVGATGIFKEVYDIFNGKNIKKFIEIMYYVDRGYNGPFKHIVKGLRGFKKLLAIALGAGFIWLRKTFKFWSREKGGKIELKDEYFTKKSKTESQLKSIGLDNDKIKQYKKTSTNIDYEQEILPELERDLDKAYKSLKVFGKNANFSLFPGLVQNIIKSYIYGQDNPPLIYKFNFKDDLDNQYRNLKNIIDTRQRLSNKAKTILNAGTASQISDLVDALDNKHNVVTCDTKNLFDEQLSAIENYTANIKKIRSLPFNSANTVNGNNIKIPKLHFGDLEESGQIINYANDYHDIIQDVLKKHGITVNTDRSLFPTTTYGNTSIQNDYEYIHKSDLTPEIEAEIYDRYKTKKIERFKTIFENNTIVSMLPEYHKVKLSLKIDDFFEKNDIGEKTFVELQHDIANYVQEFLNGITKDKQYDFNVVLGMITTALDETQFIDNNGNWQRLDRKMHNDVYMQQAPYAPQSNGTETLFDNTKFIPTNRFDYLQY